MIRRAIARVASLFGRESGALPPSKTLREQMRERSRLVEAEAQGIRRLRLELDYRDINRAAFGRDPWPRDQRGTDEHR